MLATLGDFNKQLKEKKASDECEIVIKKGAAVSNEEHKILTKELNVIQIDAHPAKAAYFYIHKLLGKWKETKLFPDQSQLTPYPTSAIPEEIIAKKMFSVIKHDKAVEQFYNQEKSKKIKTKDEQVTEEAEQILNCTPLTDVIPLNSCDVKGHAIKIDTNK